MGEENKHDADMLNERFSVLRPEVLETLRMVPQHLISSFLTGHSGRCGYEEAAFELAEKYQDFSSLVNLCHRETVYPPSENPHHRRIQTYIEKFKEDFTSELFKWYIQHGE
jgi:nuclear pore complex protein Nup133